MKNTIKKLLILLTALIMLCSVTFAVGCNVVEDVTPSGNDSAAGQPTDDTEQPTDNPETPDDDEPNVIIVVPTYYTVTFDTDGKGEVTSQSVKENEKAVKPKNPANVIVNDVLYKFKGWYIGEEEYDFNSPVTGDLTLNAKWDTETYSGDLEIR